MREKFIIFVYTDNTPVEMLFILFSLSILCYEIEVGICEKLAKCNSDDNVVSCAVFARFSYSIYHSMGLVSQLAYIWLVCGKN